MSRASFETPFGPFQLQRFPKPQQQRNKSDPLQAWDAADEYLLHYLKGELNDGRNDEPLHLANPLILNDNFGALAIPLAKEHPSVISDSFLSLEAIRLNQIDNHIHEEQIKRFSSLVNLDTQHNVVLIRIPKNLSLLEHQLYQMRQWVHQGTRVIAAGMVKHLPKSALELFNNILGDTTTSLARKKARLIFCQPDPECWTGSSPFPTELMEQRWQLKLINHANVFSGKSLDIGARFFLEVMQAQLINQGNIQKIADLGCGNGVLGIVAARLLPQADIAFFDESFMATASAKQNYQNAIGDMDRGAFHTTHSLQNMGKGVFDLILNNPPFHQQHTIGDTIAWQMFKDSHRTLKQGGELWVVGNRHLNYHAKLKRVFGNCRTLASNQKFVVLAAVKNEAPSKIRPS